MSLCHLLSIYVKLLVEARVTMRASVGLGGVGRVARGLRSAATSTSARQLCHHGEIRWQSSAIVQEFQSVSSTIGPKIASSGTNDQKLRAYALFKQATSGPVDPAKDAPSFVDFVGKAKFDARLKIKAMSKEEAMKAYIAEFGQGTGSTSSGTASAGESTGRVPRETGAAVGAVDHDVAAGSKATNPQGAFKSIMRTPMLPPDTFKGQVAFITGGGTGLGKAMATTLSKLGCTVAISSRKLDVISATAAEIEKNTGNRVLAYAADVREPEQVKAALDACEKDAGLPGIVINNAAGNFISPSERLTPNGWKTVSRLGPRGTSLYNSSGRRSRPRDCKRWHRTSIHVSAAAGSYSVLS